MSHVQNFRTICKRFEIPPLSAQKMHSVEDGVPQIWSRVESYELLYKIEY
jgi:hypothetical protein